MPEPYTDDFDIPVLAAGEAPLHGYRGALEESSTPGVPGGLTIAISREAGARGATIAKRAGEKLGWEVYSQDMLEYGAQNPSLRQDLLDKLPGGAAAWIDERLNYLLQETSLSRHPNILELAQ